MAHCHSGSAGRPQQSRPMPAGARWTHTMRGHHARSWPERPSKTYTLLYLDLEGAARKWEFTDEVVRAAAKDGIEKEIQ
jgi:hypothetical protein